MDLAGKLRSAVRGEVLNGDLERGLYATDASMYQLPPLAVVLPCDRDDAIVAAKICREANVAIVPRGAGTGLSGQAIGRAVILDLSKYCTGLIELNVEARWARVQPGLIRDELNRLLTPHGLHFAPDPATANRANIGGMIANNAAGMRSLRYGMTVDHVLEVDLLLATGEVLRLGETDEEAYEAKCAQDDREGEIYRRFRGLIASNRDEILARFPRVRRRSGGYALDQFTGGFPWNMASVVAASEGTLGIILEAKVNLEPVPPCSGLCLAHFADMGICLRTVAGLVEEGPSAVELIDGVVLRQARENVVTRDTCAVIEGEPAAILVIEAQGESDEEVRRRLEAFSARLARCAGSYAAPLMREAETIRSVWEMRSAALGLMTTVPGTRKPVPYIEDAAVPLEVLPAYIERVLAICERYGQPVSLFAHASVGLLHIRPMHDLHVQADIEQLKTIQAEVFDLVCEYGGSWSGEHGDGIVRGGYNERFFGAQLYQAFRQLKALFDPKNLMNPGKIVETPAVDADLRFGAGYEQLPLATQFHFRQDGSMLATVEQCTGVGACRKLSAGTMCPSYMATRDEVHSTRGRANALRLAMTGQLGRDGLANPDLKEVLDLCLSCKGCQSECPNRVDLARLKSETLYQLSAKHGFSWRDQLFARAAVLGAFNAGLLAPVTNAVLRFPPLRKLLASGLGISDRRPFPAYARRSFSSWWRARGGPRGAGRPVLLFVDTYMAYHLPQVGIAAVEVLEAAGYRVLAPRLGDSQRAAISRGMLNQAKRDGTKLLEVLVSYARDGVPILVCEPSCATSIADDLPDLVADPDLGRMVADQVVMVDAFLERELAAGACALPWREIDDSLLVFVHGHCHQKAIGQAKETLALLRRIPGATVTDSQAGCCGMAGAFGYEAEHFDFSVQVAEDRLLPALAKTADTAVVVANGFSCRHQIADLTPRRPLHAMELVHSRLATGRVADSQQ